MAFLIVDRQSHSWLNSKHLGKGGKGRGGVSGGGGRTHEKIKKGEPTGPNHVLQGELLSVCRVNY